MLSYTWAHLADGVLSRDLVASTPMVGAALARHLSLLAEFDERQLYRPEGYDSMLAYCVGALHLPEDSARRRTYAARTARRFPMIFPALAEGRLSLGAVVALAPKLTHENASQLIEGAAHKSKLEIEALLAEWFPKLDVPTQVQPVPAPPVFQSERAPERVEDISPPKAEAGPRPRVTPLAPQRFGIQFTLDQEAHDELRYAQVLLGHAEPSGDLAAVYRRAVKVLIKDLERRKFGACTRPASRRSGKPPRGRHVPAQVRRAVCERDGGQCTFVSTNGHRCEAKRRLEFDHILAVARGGHSTVDNLRLRCRAHNQYEAERTFGSEFMSHKRLAAAEARANAEVRAPRETAPEPPHVLEVIPWLRALGFRSDEAHRAAALCVDMPLASLDERVRRSLSCCGARGARVIRPNHLAPG